MQFDDDADLDTSEVRDVRGSRVPGGRATVGGGVIGLIALVLGVLFGVGPDQLGLSSGGEEPDARSSSAAQVNQACRKGSDANTREDCRIVAVVNSVQDFWRTEYARRGGTYGSAATVMFEAGRSGPRAAPRPRPWGPSTAPATGRSIWTWASSRNCGPRSEPHGGPFAQAYVVAHEYGHHVQNLMGTLSRAQDGRTGAGSGAVRVELQADCYSRRVGPARHHHTRRPDEWPLLTTLTEADIRDGLDAAAAVGDDRIQERFQGRVTPENWTHGSAAQRQRWFHEGYRTGDMARCDTFR